MTALLHCTTWTVGESHFELLIDSWCRDRWGFSWQITPRALLAATTDPDRAAAKRAMDAMMTMHKIDIAKIEAARHGENRDESWPREFEQ